MSHRSDMKCAQPSGSGLIPDDHGKLTDEDQVKVKAWWDAHWTRVVACPVCGSTDWSTGSHLVSISRMAADAFTPGTLTFPHVMVVSDVCGYTLFFNATMMGIGTPYDPNLDPTTRRLLGSPADG